MVKKARQPPQPWLVVVGLAFGVCVSNGFARFAYGLILPSMQDHQRWTYAEAGWINTANAIGYLAGALAMLGATGRIRASTLFLSGMAGTSVSLALSGFTQNFALLTTFRIAAGMAGAATFIAAGLLAARLFDDQRQSARAVALAYGGGGLGMVVSGAALPWYFEFYGASAWPGSWIWLGVLSAGLTAASWLALRGRTDEVPPDGGRSALPSGRLPLLRMSPALCAYGLFAMGYIVYLTFLVAWMQGHGAGIVLVSLAWSIIGLGIMVSPFAWSGVLARFSGGRPLALTTGVTAVGALLPLVAPNTVGLLASAAIFGIAVFMSPAATTIFARRNLPPSEQGSAIALFTTVFAAGQIIGPVAAGVVGDATGSITNGLAAAGVVLAFSATLALWQKSIAT